MYSAVSFNPTYLARTHGWTGSQIGWLITLTGLTGLAGTFIGGIAADRLGARRGEPRWQLWVPGAATLAVIPLQLQTYLGAGQAMTLSLLLSSLLTLVFFGPSYATAQALAAPRMRAVAAATLLFSKTLIGMGLGPLLVGMTSDMLGPWAGPQSLRYSLLLAPLVNAWAAVHFFFAARHLRADLLRVQPGN
jgi:MFS family permease